MKRLLCCILPLLAFTLGGANAWGAATRPTEAIAPGSCVTADCHAQIKSFRVLHGPVNVDACDTCHRLTEAKSHTFEQTRGDTELCTFCHQMETGGAAVVHKPLADGQCISCHNPHGGRTRALTRGKTTRELCSSCHLDVTADKQFVHGPVAAGACESCHSSHTSQFPKLLNSQGNQICFDCHRDMKQQMATAAVRHKAVEGSCMDCHDPHASAFVMQTKKEPVALCTQCHEEEKKAVVEAKHQHSVTTEGQACLTCHTAHGGQLAALMRKEPAKLCMSCHEKPIRGEGRVIASVAEVNDPKTIKHGPIRDGDCSGCHNAHGADVDSLLVKEYPATFYQAFAADKYELCFTCHDEQLVQTQQAKGLTGFRNGDQNLHFVHVNRAKGRNCRSCHSTHASTNELHVRDSVPFGKWELPIKYTRSATGGSCSPGCHKPYTYDRERPVEYEPAADEQSAGKESSK